jgi:hypothetical protein
MSKSNAGWNVVAPKGKTTGAKSGSEGKKKPVKPTAEPKMVQVVAPFREWKLAPVLVVSSSFSGLPKAVTGHILSFLAGLSPRFLLRCSTVCKLWRQLLLSLLHQPVPPRWDGFDECVEACEALNHGESIVANGMLVAFVYRRELPGRPPQAKVSKHTAAMHAKVAQWLAARGPRTEYDQLAKPHAESRSLESMRGAFAHFDKTLRQQILVGEEMEDTLPFFGDRAAAALHETMRNVPRGEMSALLMASLLCNDAAYSQQRDDYWPLDACREWVRERLRELDAGDDFEVYFPGQFWFVTGGAGGAEYECGGMHDCFFKTSITCSVGCVCVTRHAVLVICGADED